MNRNTINSEKKDFLLALICISKSVYGFSNLGNVIIVCNLLKIDFYSYFSFDFSINMLDRYNNFFVDEKTKILLITFIEKAKIYLDYDVDSLMIQFNEELRLEKKEIIDIAIIKDILSGYTFFPTVLRVIFKGYEDFSFFYDVPTLMNDLYLTNNDSLIEKNFVFLYSLNSYEKQIADEFGVFSCDDLIKASTIPLFLIFSNKISDVDKMIVSMTSEDILPTFNSDVRDITFNFYEPAKEDIIMNLFGSIKDQWTEIICEKNNIVDGILNLEETGKLFGVTRQRIRQIECKVMEKLYKTAKRYGVSLDKYLMQFFTDKPYVDIDKLLEQIDDKRFLSMAATVLLNDLSTNLTIDTELRVVAIKNIFDEEIKKILESWDFIMLPDQYNSLCAFEKRLVNKYYRISKNGIIIKKGFREAELYCRVCDELFPNGINVSKESVALINKYIEKNFDCICNMNVHAFTSLLVRKNYVTIDRGTYQRFEKAAHINDCLKEKIISYIFNNKQAIWYHSLYELFKAELNKDGVFNRYHLKGVLDPYLPSEIITKKDYLCSSESFLTAKEQLIKEIRCNDGIISMEQLRKNYPGVKDYVFTGVLTSEKAVQIDHDRYINIKNVNLSCDFLNVLKREIDYLLDSLDSSVVSSRKIYARMRILHNELMSESIVLSNHFSLFSIIKSSFSNDYFLKRPFVSKEEKAISVKSIVEKHLSSLDKFNFDSLNEYENSIGIKCNNYLELMIDNSDRFVQISVDTCVNKKFFESDMNLIKILMKELNYFLNSFGKIDTREYKGYSLLPTLKYKWNKYLLAGIVRSFFGDLFNIEYTTSMHNTTDFIIRRY